MTPALAKLIDRIVVELKADPITSPVVAGLPAAQLVQIVKDAIHRKAAADVAPIIHAAEAEIMQTVQLAAAAVQLARLQLNSE